MKLEQLKALDAVVRAGSFARAANEILLVTQPAVTKAVQNLEAELGFALFSRAGYRPVLTPEGEAFYLRAQRILAQVDDLSSFGAQLASGVEPELKLAADAYFLLPEMLKAFHRTNQAYTSTPLHIRCEMLGSAIRLLLEKQVDLAIAFWSPDYARFAQLVHKPLARIKGSTVVAADFPLLQLQRTVTPADLAPYVQVVERTDNTYLTSADRNVHCESQHWYVNDVHVKKQIILSGRSYGILPYHLIEQELASGQLVPFHNLEGFQVFELEIRAVYLKERLLGPVFSHLWRELKAP